MPACMTVSVSNIHPNATEHDIISHFNSRLERSNPIVGPLVPYIKKKEVKRGIRRVQRQATTVTFQGEDYSDCEYGREFKLHGSVLKCGVDVKTDIAVTKEFLGISPLQQHDEHQFDFLFVHDLGGHPFKSWTSGIESPKDLKMWPRDLLPQLLLEKGYSGRYSTVGYKASGLGGRASTSATINRAAEDLLAVLWNGTQLHDHRPMYFACHGLGGLVLCQALNLLLWKSNDSQVKFRGKNIFLPDGQCSVKGIAFFGTPFEEFATVTQKFKQVRATHNIEILLYYEGQPDKERTLSTTGTSFDFAEHAFGDSFEPTTLNADRAGMIQFADEQDGNYERVSKDIFKLIGTTLPTTSKTTPTERYPAPPVSSRPSSPDEGSQGHEDEAIIDTQDIRPQDSFNTTEINREGFLKRFRKGLQRSFHKAKPGKSTTNVPQRSRRLSLVVPENMHESLRPVHGFDKVLILDDSASMRDLSEVAQLGRSIPRWEILIECVQELCNAVTQSGDNGIDIHFLVNRHKDTRNVRSSEQAWEILRGINLGSSKASSLDDVLWRVLNGYLDKHRNYVSRKRTTGTSSNTRIKALERPKPLNVIVITDGVSDDHENVEATLIRAARDLPRLKIPQFHIGIQFVQIGKVERTNRWLKLLDDKIRVLYGIRDICDTRMYEYEDDVDAETLHDPVEFQRLLVTKIQEILLGSVDERYQGFRKDDYWSDEA